MERALARMEEVNPALNAVVHPRAERALEEARGLSDAPAAGFAGRHRPLAGVPIAVKDLGCEQAGEPHHRGSRLLAEAGRREHEDSHLYGLLAGAGAVSLGRTNTPEFGTTITTEPAVYGPTANPWSLDHSAGGSSGGSAAAVAAGIVTVAHGNDGGGSVRIPASACGLVGLKPTRGRVSTGPHRGEHRGGLAVDAMLTRTVRDAALCLDVVSVPAVGDPYGVAGPPAAS
ncbi:MAG TPA: amidase, partial [Acidimicrobiaceae bacterium]|nr:amidase [Acidimicrobiaceae bacterium]